MKLIKSITSMQKISRILRKNRKTIGFVPTMGYLHEGHLSLVKRAVRDCDITVMSIYVNPLQFGPSEDFKSYPRDLKRDMSLAKSAGADYIFLPSNKQMYPSQCLTSVEVTGISRVLCGVSRPGHFKGVTTVVAKLFNVVSPDMAYFGQKDAQQSILIQKMVKDLNLPLKVKVLPIIRESDGLAMSSRNAYLTSAQRKVAVLLYKSLQQAKAQISQGERNPRKIVQRMKRLISESKFATIDYINIVDADDLSEKKKIKGRVLIALAVFIGKVRLIDNVIIRV
ncbi:MAG: pantoate--beta-alanine ligase [PVC group bacterium]|nr:pantoate--beta-alanine ligase [PVC group bacterium]